MRFYALPFGGFYSIIPLNQVNLHRNFVLTVFSKKNPQYRYPITEFLIGKVSPPPITTGCFYTG